MSEKDNSGKNPNTNKDLFADFRKDNSNIDELLEDAFSFLNKYDDFDEKGNAQYNYSTISDDKPGQQEAVQESFAEQEYSDYDAPVYDDLSTPDYNADYTPKNQRVPADSRVEEDSEEMEEAKKKKVLYSILIAFLSLCIVAVIVVLVFNGKFDDIYDEGLALPTKAGETLAEEEDFDTMFDVGDAASLNDYLKKWANNNGEIMDSKNVINILLIGQDASGSENSNGRSDSLIIASVNKKTKTITLASIMRDSYIYMNVDGDDRYDKINAACFFGGPKGIIEVIEKNYKIDIDYYVSVYFESFENVIDALGGVNVPVEPGFASYINRTTRYNISSGDSVLLNGGEALAYSRIRKYYPDSDVSRTKNQRRVITGIMNKVKGANVAQLYKAIDAVLPYIKTNMKKNAILSYGKQALSENWIGYEMKQETFPTQDARASATINGASCWAVDYPLAAQQLQKLLYGKTNISLSNDRVNVLTNYLNKKPENSGSNSNSSSYDYNNYSSSYYYNTTEATTYSWSGETTTYGSYETTAPSVEDTTVKDWWGGDNTQSQTPATDAPATPEVTTP